MRKVSIYAFMVSFLLIISSLIAGASSAVNSNLGNQRMEKGRYMSIIQGNSTVVGGYISQNTTWASSGSPYIVTADVVVVADVFLTIEPGVIVKFASGTSIVVDGGLIARGDAAHVIVFTSNAATPAPDDWETIRFRGSVFVFEYCTVEFAVAGILMESPADISYCNVSKCHIGLKTALRNVSNVMITDCEAEGINTPGYNANFESCTISNNYGDGIYAGSCEVRNSIITNNSGDGIHTWDAKIYGNNISDNHGDGVWIGPNLGLTEVNYNNIVNNQGYGLSFWASAQSVLNATYNWWGTTNETLIQEKIYDYYDDYNLGTVFYEPYLQARASRTVIVPDDYSTIQGAINAASDGDTIFVRNGTYYENVVVNKTLNLIGENRNSTIVDGNNIGNVVTLDSNNVNVSGFTFQNSAARTLGLYGCISLNQVSGCSIFSNTADNSNASGSGDGIFLQSSEQNNISDNLFINTWDGITLWGSSNNTISGNTVVNNLYVGGTAIQFCYGSPFNQAIDNAFLGISQIGIRCYQADSGSNVLIGNVVENYWNGIYADGSSNNIFYHNSIINSTINQAYLSDNVNVWDNGYPSGGNYWSDFKGTDFYGGPYQNISGSDGIGDTPYVINQQNLDHYPLMNEFPPTNQSVGPVADFTYSPSTPIANETITFDASISKNGWSGNQSIAISMYAWDFGDNNTATGQVATHSYEMSGNFMVTLNVTDAQGLWNITEEQVQVGQPHSPVAAFTIYPELTNVGQDIQLNASVSLPGWNGTQENPITSYLWNFGDGNVTSSGDSTIVHSYAYAGIFNATLTVSDSESMNSSCSHTILAIMPTSISVSTSATSSLIGYVVSINGTLSDVYGNAMGNEPIVFFYTFPGVTSWFPITSSITDNNGLYDVQWIPTATGTFTIMAGWAGNITYSGASGNVTLNSIPAMNQYVFSVESNSTITGLAFNTTSQELSFTASGPSGTTGYAKVTIAKSLVSNITDITVYLDNNQTEYSITSIDDSWLLMFNYTHSTHTVRVDLTTSVVPEFSNDLILFLLITLAAAVLVAEKRKPAKLHSNRPIRIC